MNQALIQNEVGISIWIPEEHYTISGKSRACICRLIREQYGIDPTDEVVEAFIEGEELPHWVHTEAMGDFVEDEAEAMGDRVERLLDTAYFFGEDKS